MIHVMIIEDEPAAVLILRKMIEKAEGFEVTEVCGTVSQALAAYMKSRPEVCFVDVDLNGESGMVCAKTITELNPDVRIVFATAHSEFMADAFDIYAFDYLVKPFSTERVLWTMERIRKSMNAANAPSGANGEAGNSTEKSVWKDTSDKTEEKQVTRLILHGREKTVYLDTDDILMAEHVEDATVISTRDGQYSTSMAMKDVENQLPDDLFIRCYKSYIVNLKAITSVEPYGRWTFVVHLKGTDRTALATAVKCEEINKKLNKKRS